MYTSITGGFFLLSHGIVKEYFHAFFTPKLFTLTKATPGKHRVPLQAQIQSIFISIMRGFDFYFKEKNYQLITVGFFHHTHEIDRNLFMPFFLTLALHSKQGNKIG